VHPTGGTLRVFKQFVWLGVGSGKTAWSRPTHQRVTHTVGRGKDYNYPSFYQLSFDPEYVKEKVHTKQER
jgi:hypothetical protein